MNFLKPCHNHPLIMTSICAESKRVAQPQLSKSGSLDANNASDFSPFSNDFEEQANVFGWQQPFLTGTNSEASTVVSGSSQNLVKGGAVGHDASHYDSSGTQLVLIDSAELRSRFYIYQYSLRIRVILNWGNADRYKTGAKWPCSIFGGHFEYASSLWPLDAIVSPSIFAAL